MDDRGGLPGVVPQLVRCVERHRDVRDDPGGDGERERDVVRARLGEDLLQGLPAQVLHREIAGAVHRPAVEDLADVRVIDARDDARLGEEHLLEALVPGVLRVHHLEGNPLREPVVAAKLSQVDARHPPVRDVPEEGVPPKPLRLVRDRRGQRRLPLTHGPGCPYYSPNG